MTVGAPTLPTVRVTVGQLTVPGDHAAARAAARDAVHRGRDAGAGRGEPGPDAGGTGDPGEPGSRERGPGPR